MAAHPALVGCCCSIMSLTRLVSLGDSDSCCARRRAKVSTGRAQWLRARRYGTGALPRRVQERSRGPALGKASLLAGRTQSAALKFCRVLGGNITHRHLSPPVGAATSGTKPPITIY